MRDRDVTGGQPGRGRFVTAAVGFVAENADIHRFLGLVLLVGLVVGPYLTMQEIDRGIGEGVPFRVLFQRPANATKDDLRGAPDAMEGKDCPAHRTL